MHKIGNLMANLNLSIDMYSIYSNEVTERTLPQPHDESQIILYIVSPFASCNTKQQINYFLRMATVLPIS